MEMGADGVIKYCCCSIKSLTNGLRHELRSSSWSFGYLAGRMDKKNYAAASSPLDH
jgi:thiazole synthase ThiGH ThiG subunit